MYYLSKRTISLLAELGDAECTTIKDSCLDHAFGFVAKGGKVKFGPTFWTEFYTEKATKNLRRLNAPTLSELVSAYPMLRK